MGVMVVGAKHGFWKSKLRRHPAPSVSTLSWTRVQLLVELWSQHMQLVWIDANNGAVDFVQASNLEGVLSALYHIPIELIPLYR